MHRRKLSLCLAAVAAMVALAALSEPRKPRLLLLGWAGRTPVERSPAAVLIELGLKDTSPTPWPGQARVKGARVVHREGYRFRDDDHLTGRDGWKVSSHRQLRVPPRQPALARTEGIATVGVVLHLADVAGDATLTVEPGDGEREKVSVPLADVLAGKPHPLWGGAGVVRLVSTATLLHPGSTEDDFPAAAYGPDGTLWVAFIAYRLKDEGRRVEQRPLKEQPGHFKEFDKPSFGDQLFVKYLRYGKWSLAVPLTGPDQDLVRCAVAVEKDGTAWVVYSANRKGRHDLYARPVGKKYSTETTADPAPRPGPEQALTRGGASNLTPVAVTDQSGRVVVACQSWIADTAFGTRTFTCADGKWREGPYTDRVTSAGRNCWSQALAPAPDGKLALGFDVYRDGDYDVLAKVIDKDSVRDLPVAASARFEARPSLCYDDKGRLWIAYEEGPERWGNDYGALDTSGGNPLYNERSVRVVCLVDGKLMEPVAKLPTSRNPPPRIPFEGRAGPNYEKGRRYSNPRLGLDGKGRLWLTYREKFGTRYSTHPGSYWLTFARRLDGDRWTEPVEVHHSDGLLDHRPALLPHPGGGLVIFHNADGRYTTPNKVQNRVYVSVVDLPGEPVEPKLVAHEPGKKDGKGDARERAAVQRIRDYRVEAGGKKLRPLRGEFHRHTEMSWDGGPDGSLEDMFRYAIDAASLDWIGNGDHDNGAGREYSWWLIQKLTDAYHVAGHFTPVFSYERSVAYPHGHRNCMFARRGVRTLPRLAEPDPRKRVGGVHADDTKMLYRYLRELGGLCAVHTSATGMGTDWRDNDPEVEPFVEIYQGDRMSYEQEGAPRAGYDPKSGKKPANIAGWFPKGYVDRALARGHRLGFESSSDHWSTHISYCVALAEAHDRESILKAFRQRHCYAATDNIVLDVRSGGHLMGDVVKTAEAPALTIKVIGTGPLDRVEVLKDSKVAETFSPRGAELTAAWTDPKPSAGKHYYYVRVQQKDGQLAWASPLWFERAE